MTILLFKVQGGIPSLVPFGNQSGLPLGVSIPALQPVKQQTTISTNTSKSDDSTQTTSSETQTSNVPPPPPLVAAVTITPHTQELLQQFGLTTKDRNSITEVLKMKNINILDTGAFESLAISNPQLHGNHITGQVNILGIFRCFNKNKFLIL